MVNQKVARKDLVDAVVKASTSDTWDEAVKEWEFSAAWSGQTNCICGQIIYRIYEIKNTINGKTLAPIGSDCIKKFGVQSLSKEIDLQLKILHLKEAFENGEQIEVNSQYFSRALLLYFLKNNVFRSRLGNSFNAELDYQLLLDTFNRKTIYLISEKKEIGHILLNYIKPYVTGTWDEKEYQKQLKIDKNIAKEREKEKREATIASVSNHYHSRADWNKKEDSYQYESGALDDILRQRKTYGNQSANPIHKIKTEPITKPSSQEQFQRILNAYQKQQAIMLVPLYFSETSLNFLADNAIISDLEADRLKVLLKVFNRSQEDDSFINQMIQDKILPFLIDFYLI